MHFFLTGKESSQWEKYIKVKKKLASRSSCSYKSDREDKSISRGGEENFVEWMYRRKEELKKAPLNRCMEERER